MKNPTNKKKRNKIITATLSTVAVLSLTFAGVKHLDNLSEEDLNKSNVRVDERLAQCYINCNEIVSTSYESKMIDISSLNNKLASIAEEKRQQEESARITELIRAKEEARLAELARIEAERKHKEELEKERLRRLEEKKSQPVIASRGSEYKGVNQSLGTFNVSWYGSDCAGCSGQTSSGVWVNKSIYYQGYGVAAADWSVIPAYSIIEVQGYGKYIVLDKGGAIKGSKLDLLTTSEAKSNEYGRQHLNVTVLRWGR